LLQNLQQPGEKKENPLKEKRKNIKNKNKTGPDMCSFLENSIRVLFYSIKTMKTL